MPTLKKTRKDGPEDSKFISSLRRRNQLHRKSAFEMGRIDDFDITADEDDWNELVKKGRVKNFSINTLPAEFFGPASKASHRQYAMLRSYSPLIQSRHKFYDNMGRFGFNTDLISEASKTLKSSDDWCKYICVLRKGIPESRLQEGDPAWPGSFMAAKRLQEQTATVNGVHDGVRYDRNQPDAEFTDAEDESTPNAAIIVLLQAISQMVPQSRVEWVLNKVRFVAIFKDGRSFHAYTDGALRSKVGLHPMAIVEVKKCVRGKGKQAIIIQETCQVIGWLMQTTADMAVFNGQ